jgi:dsDNA-specific endonuclease/ATPase MutS2
MKIGDRVSVVDDVLSGIVVEMGEDGVTVETDDGFRLQFEVAELVVENKKLSGRELLTRDVSEIISEKKSKTKRKTPRLKPKERSRPPMVVDLHIEKLTKQHSRMSNYDMLTLQLDTAERQLKFALSKKMQRVVFVHGVGEGVLKAELETLFRRYDTVLKYYEADPREYGRGATEVYIFQNATTGH